jgi:cytochrome c-type biogenesis protein CcmH/NrfG
LAADFSWTPPLVVLALGAVAGAVVVGIRSRFKTQSAPPAPATSHAADLQRQYDALIRRLAEGGTPEEKAAIEVEAARVLMQMETPGTLHADTTARAAKSETVAATPAAPTRQAPAWVGFLYGVLTMGTLGGLFYLASSGATERASGGSPTGGNTMGSRASAGEEAPQTSAEDQAAILALEEAVRKTPTDLGQRIELTRAYLRQRDLMKVFDQTKAILEVDPGNAHGLTYQALVRVAMGQAAQAETMLLDAIKKDPRIEDAYIHLAIARIQLGNRKAAEEAIQAGQLQFPEDKEQLADVFQQIANASDGKGDAAAPPAAERPAEVAPAAAADAGSARTSASLVVVIDLPKGLTVPNTAMLFVIVREAGFETGPPVAVKRVPAVNFPITVTLSEKDSMAGESLPGLIRLDARIDRDGDPLTKDPRDPVASEDNVRPGAGQLLLVLTPAKN